MAGMFSGGLETYLNVNVDTSGLSSLDKLSKLLKEGGIAADAASSNIEEMAKTLSKGTSAGANDLTVLGASFDAVSRNVNKLTQQIEAYTSGLKNAARMQTAFQTQTVPDLQRGHSIFAGRHFDEARGKMVGGPGGRGIQPMNEALQEAQQMSLGANEGMSRYKQTINDAGEKVRQYTGSQQQLSRYTKETGESAGRAGGQFGKMFGLLMNTMFAGMALSQVFGKMAGSMMKMFGVTETAGAAKTMILLPFFSKLAPVLNKIILAFSKMPKPIKMGIGAMVALLALLGPMLFFGSQLGLMATQLSISFASLTASLLGVILVFGAVVAIGYAVSQIFKEFGVIAGVAASIIGGALVASMISWLVSLEGVSLALTKIAATGFVSTLTSMAGALISYLVPALTSAWAVTTSLAASTWSLVAAYSSILLPIGALVLGILLLQRIFKKFGPIVGLLATIIGGVLLAALTPIGAIILTIYGAFKAVNKIFKKFGKIAGVIAALVVGVIAVVIGAFGLIPVAIGLAIGAAIALIWNFKDDIINALKGLWNWITKWGDKLWQGVVDGAEWLYNLLIGNSIIKDLVNDIKTWIGKLINFFSKLPSKIISAVAGIAKKVMSIGEDIVSGIVDGITSMSSAISNALYGLLPDKLKTALDTAKGVGGDVLSSVTDILTPNDFILTSGGKMIKPHKNDTIIGTKTPGQLGSGGGDTVNVEISDTVVREEADIQRIVDEVEERVNRDTRGRNGLGT